MSGLQDPEQPEGGLGLTTGRQALTAVLAGAVLGWFIVGTLQAMGSTVPVTPWSLALVMGALGAAAWVYSRVLRRQVAESRGALPHESGVRALVMGKTMLMTGAILGGGHLVYALVFLRSWSIPTPRERVIHGAAAILASIVFGLAGRELERACLVPPGQGTQDDDEAEPQA